MTLSLPTLSSWSSNGTFDWGYALTINGGIVDMTLSPDETYLVLVDKGSSIYKMTLSSKTLVMYSLDTISSTNRLSISPDSTKILLTGFSKLTLFKSNMSLIYGSFSIYHQPYTSKFWSNSTFIVLCNGLGYTALPNFIVNMNTSSSTKKPNSIINITSPSVSAPTGDYFGQMDYSATFDLIAFAWC